MSHKGGDVSIEPEPAKDGNVFACLLMRYRNWNQIWQHQNGSHNGLLQEDGLLQYKCWNLCVHIVGIRNAAMPQEFSRDKF
jgi:hypothetical protein